MISVRTFISLWILHQSTTFNKGFSDTFFLDHLQHDLDHEVNDLDPADEREACEEPHGASYSRQLVHKLGCSVLFDNIKGRGGHWNLHKLESIHEIEFRFSHRWESRSLLLRVFRNLLRLLSFSLASYKVWELYLTSPLLSEVFMPSWEELLTVGFYTFIHVYRWEIVNILCLIVTLKES